MHHFSRFRSSLLVILLLVACCFLPHHFNHKQSHNAYHEKLLNKMEKCKDFSSFSELLFRYNVTSDSITTAYTLNHPNHYSIPSLDSKLSTFSFSNYLENIETGKPQNTERNLRNKLHTFSNTLHSTQEQIDYHILDNYLSLLEQSENYPFYEELLGPTSGIQANLPITVCEYPLHSQKDIDTYLELLSQLPQYCNEIIAYEKARSKTLCQTPSFIRQSTYEGLVSFTDDLRDEKNCFLQTFQERIASIPSLSAKKQKHYILQNRHYVNKYVLPAFLNLLDYTESTLSNSQETNSQHSSEATSHDSSETTSHDSSETISHDSSEKLTQSSSRNKEDLPDLNTPYGLSSLPNGTDYYELLTKMNTGSDKSPADMIAQTESLLTSTLSTVKKIALEEPDVYLYYCDHPAISYLESPSSILESLALQIRDNYPKLKQTPTYQIKTVPQSLATQLSPAFYMIPAIDNDQQNTIYINPLYTNAQKGTLFTTLAHEGFPGHLYQTLYFNSTNPALFRHTLDYPGYVEGWATYVEINAFPYMNLPNASPSLIELYKADTLISLALSSRVDLGVNFENWTLSDANAFFEKQGFKTYYTADLYSYVVESPATYLRYFIGYLEIEELKTLYKNQHMQNYTDKSFHQHLLTLGPADFTTLRTFLLTP